MLKASHEAESRVQMRRKGVDAACSQGNGAYIERAPLFAARIINTAQALMSDLNRVKRGVGSLRAGVFFVRNVNDRAAIPAVAK